MSSYLCGCGQELPESLERIGASRAMCPCGQPCFLDEDSQAAYAERARKDVPEPPRAAPPEASVTPPPADPAPAGEGAQPDPAPAGASSAWTEAEISAEAQLPVEAEAEVEDEPAPTPPPRRAAGDVASWVAG